MAIFCGNCGNKIKNGEEFCDKCGTKVVVPEKRQNNVIIKDEKTIEKNDEDDTNIADKPIIVEDKLINVEKNDTNVFALAGMIMGICNIFCCGAFSLFGLAFSILGLVKSNKSNDNGRGFAITGIILNGIFVIGVIIGNISNYLSELINIFAIFNK